MEQLVLQFIDRYLPRNEIIHRLPLSVPIGKLWPELEKERRRRSTELPLYTQEGKPFRFVVNATIEAQCDRIAEMARREIVFSGPEFDVMYEDAVIDEAVYSSLIEGAFTSRAQAVQFIRRHNEPKNKSEQMVKNNYDALTYVLEHLEEPITEETAFQIARIVTQSASEVQVNGYRTGPVYVTGRDGVVYTPPEAKRVPEMMKRLFAFIAASELPPVLKACIAHFYFAYVHPFGDGNGRTARALSYMMLLQAGYDFFRYFSISGIVAQERGKYYRAMLNVEESDGDMTYFIDCYSGMLARAVQQMDEHLKRHVLAGRRFKELQSLGKLNDRQLRGAKWLLESENDRVTVEAWKKKFKTVTETARRDLLLLCECGMLTRTMEGRKAVFHIKYSNDGT